MIGFQAGMQCHSTWVWKHAIAVTDHIYIEFYIHSCNISVGPLYYIDTIEYDLTLKSLVTKHKSHTNK